MGHGKEYQGGGSSNVDLHNPSLVCKVSMYICILPHSLSNVGVYHSSSTYHSSHPMSLRGVGGV